VIRDDAGVHFGAVMGVALEGRPLSLMTLLAGLGADVLGSGLRGGRAGERQLKQRGAEERGGERQRALSHDRPLTCEARWRAIHRGSWLRLAAGVGKLIEGAQVARQENIAPAWYRNPLEQPQLRLPSWQIGCLMADPRPMVRSAGEP
jgi:hypothetical protein